MTAKSESKRKAAPRKKKKPSTAKPDGKNERLTPLEMKKRVCAVLVEVMNASESDSVRVAAARALMDKIMKSETEGDEGKQNANRQRAAIKEAQQLIASFAAAKSVGVERPGTVD